MHGRLMKLITLKRETNNHMVGVWYKAGPRIKKPDSDEIDLRWRKAEIQSGQRKMFMLR